MLQRYVGLHASIPINLGYVENISVVKQGDVRDLYVIYKSILIVLGRMRNIHTRV